MTELPVSWGALTVFTVFVANSIGCVLATYCLVRIGDPHRSTGKRVMMAIVASFVLLETARDDMFLVLASARRPGDLYIRYAMKPDLILIATVMIFLTAVMLVVVWRPTRLMVTAVGAVAGAAMSIACIAPLRTTRSDFPMAIDTRDAAVLSIVFALVTSIAFRMAVGASRRPPIASSIMIVSVSLTLLQFLLARELVMFGPGTPGPVTGRTPALVIAITLGAFLARVLLLTVVSLIDTSGLPHSTASDPRPGRESSIVRVRQAIRNRFPSTSLPHPEPSQPTNAVRASGRAKVVPPLPKRVKELH